MNQVIDGSHEATDKQQRKRATQKLNDLVDSASRVYYSCQSVFPFSLFPDKVIIDQNKIDIIYKTFFFTKYVFTILISDLKTVKVNTGPIFASMQFEMEGYEQNPPPVNYLFRPHALKAREIIMGLTAAKTDNIELQKVDQSKVKQQAETIGSITEK